MDKWKSSDADRQGAIPQDCGCVPGRARGPGRAPGCGSNAGSTKAPHACQGSALVAGGDVDRGAAAVRRWGKCQGTVVYTCNDTAQPPARTICDLGVRAGSRNCTPERS